MRRRNSLPSLSIAALVAVSSCAVPKYFPPPRSHAPEDRSYDGSFERVWAALLEAVAALQIPVEESEVSSGSLQSGPLDETFRKGVDCGDERIVVEVERGIVTDSKRAWQSVAENPNLVIDYRMTAVVREAEDGRTRVRLGVAMVGYRWTDGDPFEVRCESTGVLEKALFKAVETRLKASEKAITRGFEHPR